MTGFTVPQRLVTTVVLLTLLACLGSATAIDLNPRRHILIVGSSTAYPIIAAAAEFVGRRDKLTTPVVESTGTGGGFKFFCGGIGPSYPDLEMASRPMKGEERAACSKNGIDDIREIKIGYDGIVVANMKGAPKFVLTSHALYLALAREVPSPGDAQQPIENAYQNWNDIDPSLPDLPIRVLGPPPTSGTRDILVERLMQRACLDQASLRELQASDPDAFKQRCYALREDGAFINAGENDARLVRKLLVDPGALGIFGFNFLDRNHDRLQGASINGIDPTFESIESGTYPLSRPLFLYVKQQHQAFIEGLELFVDAVTSTRLSGKQGYLIEHGLIPIPEKQRKTGDPMEKSSGGT